jgi:hypothetical protein
VVVNQQNKSDGVVTDLAWRMRVVLVSGEIRSLIIN